MRRIAAGLIVIMSVLLVSCKGKTGNTITVGSDKLIRSHTSLKACIRQQDVIQDIITLINVAHQLIILCFMMISRKKVLCYVINHNVGMMEKSAWHIFQEASLKVSCITIIRTYI